MLSSSVRFDLVVDQQAKGWLDRHPDTSRLFIAFASSRVCCSGVRICDVRIRFDVHASQRSPGGTSWSRLSQVDGRDVFMDSRLVERMPRQLSLTARGAGPFRHLDLDLTGEQWAELLYPL